MPLYSTHAPRVPAGDGMAVTVTAVPYHLWGNRSPGAMRVWIPTIPGSGR